MDTDLPDIPQEQQNAHQLSTSSGNSGNQSKEIDKELQSVKAELFNVNERLTIMLKALRAKGDERTRLMEELKSTEVLFNKENADPANSVQTITPTVIPSNLNAHDDPACQMNEQEVMEVSAEEQTNQSAQERADEEANTKDPVIQNLFSLLQQAPPDSPNTSNTDQDTAAIEVQNSALPQTNFTGFEEIMQQVAQPTQLNTSSMMPETSNNPQHEKRKKERQKRQKDGVLPSGDLVGSLINLAAHANDSTVVGELEMTRPKPEQLENEEPVMSAATENNEEQIQQIGQAPPNIHLGSNSPFQLSNQQQHGFAVNGQTNAFSGQQVCRIQNGTFTPPNLQLNGQQNWQQAQNPEAPPTYQQATHSAQFQALQMQGRLNYMSGPRPLNGQQISSSNQRLEGNRPGIQQSSSNLSNENQHFGMFPPPQYQYLQQYQSIRPMPAQFMHPQLHNFMQYQNPPQAMQAMQYAQRGNEHVNPVQALNSNNAIQQKICIKCHVLVDRLTRQMCQKCYKSVAAKERRERKREEAAERLKEQQQAMLLMQSQQQPQTSFDRQTPVATHNDNNMLTLQDILRGIATPPISLNTHMEQMNGLEISGRRCTSASSNAIDSGSISIQSRLSTPQLIIDEHPIGDTYPREVSPIPLNEIYQAVGPEAAPVELILLSSDSEDES